MMAWEGPDKRKVGHGVDQVDMQRAVGSAWLVKEGWHVVGSDGAKVGEIEDVRSNCLVVSRGIFFTTERFVPVTAIRAIEGDCVYLDVTKDQIEASGWDVEPSPVVELVADPSTPTEPELSEHYPTAS